MLRSPTARVLDETDESAVSKGGALGYSEASPYTAFDLERENAWAEDSNRVRRS